MPNLNEELISDVFGEEKSEKAMTLLKDVEGRIAAAAEEKVAEVLADRGLGRSSVVKSRPVDKKLALLVDIFKHNGLCRKDGSRWTKEDFFQVDTELLAGIREGRLKKEDYVDWQTMSEQPLMFPQVITNEVKEAIEPELNLTPLMQKLSWQGIHGVLQAVSAMNAGSLEIGEATEYPEGKLQWGATVAFMIGKHGIKVSFTDEALRYSQFDVWSMHLRAAGRALARHKEKQAVQKVLNQGTVYIDNGDASARHTTGRDETGAYNGTFTVWDLFDTAADLIQAGYVPDLIIMHPFAWPIFALDPVMRAMGFMMGGKVMSGYQGTPGQFPNSPGGLLQNRNANEPANLATTYSNVPAQYPFGPMKIVVSPHVDYDRTANTTTLYIADSRDLGILITEAPVQSEEWTTPEKDLRNIKFMERYTFATANKGTAIRQVKKVVVARSYHFEHGMLNAEVTIDTSVFTVS